MPVQSPLRLWAGHTIRVVVRAAPEEVLANPTVPDPARLITQIIEAVREYGIDQVILRVEQQCDALCLLRVEGEVPRRGFFDPGRPEGKRRSFRRGPVPHPFILAIRSRHFGRFTCSFSGHAACESSRT